MEYVGIAVRTALSMVSLPALNRKRVDQLEALCLIMSTIEDLDKGVVNFHRRFVEHHRVVCKEEMVNTGAASSHPYSYQRSFQFSAAEAREDFHTHDKEIGGNRITLSDTTG
ncbi:unnamed protein product [Brassica oleracea var. botrytis]